MKTQVYPDYPIKSRTYDNEDQEITDINEAIEEAGFGLGTALLLSASYAIIALDAVEISVISVVGLMVRCEWDLTTTSMTVLQVSGVVGQLLVAMTCSNISEVYGRKNVMLIGAVIMSVLGILSGAWSQFFWQLFVLRILIGGTIAFCTPAAAVYPVEVVPIAWRAVAQAGVGCAWGVGAVVTSVVAYLTIGPLGWRGFLIFGTLSISPCIILIAVARESPRFDMMQGNVARAEQSIRYIARWNGKRLSKRLNLKSVFFKSDLIEEASDTTVSGLIKTVRETGKMMDLIKIISMSMLSIFIYSTVGYSTPRFLNEGYCGSSAVTKEQSCVFNKDVLFDIGLVGISEPLSSVLVAYLLDKIGRRNTNILVMVVTFLSLSALHICVNHGFLILSLIVLKGAVNLLTTVPFVLLREHMPTRVRAFCYYVNYVIGRTAVIFAMSITQFAFEANPRILIFIAQFAVSISFIIQSLLKVETRGVQID